MNTPFFFSPRSVSLAALLVFTAEGFAQTAAGPAFDNKVSPAVRDLNASNYRTAMAKARALARSNDPVAVEQAVTALNRSKSNTAAWHQETAGRLLQLAGDVAKEAQTAAARGLVARAEARLGDALGLATSQRTKAHIHSSLGFIHERYHGDLVAAIGSYRAATTALPVYAPAVEALQRLELTQAHARVKGRN